MNTKQLVEKYDRPAPRYNCYPAAPYWQSKTSDSKKWLNAVKKEFELSNSSQGITLYLHMPFCESLCTFCGFEKRITTNHFVEDIYIDALVKQWQLYLDNLPATPELQNIYMGGGTPTFFSPDNLHKLFSNLQKYYHLKDGFEGVFEGHPNSTTEEHLGVLYDFGFRQMNLGIQDFDEQVQSAINRRQTFEAVKKVTDTARSIGFTTIKYDMIYGLPHQTTATVKYTIDKIAKLMPDNIAFYSYMHVPWKQPSQASFKETTLPKSLKKRSLFEFGRDELKKLGYHQVGLDHFSKKDHKLYQSYVQKKLRRNINGYTVFDTNLLLGIGAIALSETPTAYAQNTVSVEAFHDKVFNNQLPLEKTFFLEKQDQLLKEFIEDIMCKAEGKWSQAIFDSLNSEAKAEVISLQKEELIDVNEKGFNVTEKGMPFLRNICQVFDAQHHRNMKNNNNQQFSSAV